MSDTEEVYNAIEPDRDLIARGDEYVQFPKTIVNQIKDSGKIEKAINECLNLDPEDLSSMSIDSIDRYLILIPKALVWVQECENEARNALDDAEDAYCDTITLRAAGLSKDQFDTSQITEKMRIAKIRERFPSEYERRVKEVRTRRNMLSKLHNQARHLERYNDNLKKVRESLVIKFTKDRVHEE